MKWVPVTGRDAYLEALDFGGDGPGVLLLHGLAGTAREWEGTAEWLTRTHHVVALEQRGHGRSERRPDDVSREAFVRDAAAAIEQLGLTPVVLVGQSLGGHTAILVAAERPDLVRGLVVAEASPAEADPAATGQVAKLLSSWPVPFPTHDAAIDFFGGHSVRARAWADNLEEFEGGLTRAFEVDVMIQAITAAGDARWHEWRRIEAPTLIVRGESGELSLDDANSMLGALPGAALMTVPGGHDVHLDAPDAWRNAVAGFLAGLS